MWGRLAARRVLRLRSANDLRDKPSVLLHVFVLQVQVLLAKADNPGQSAFECQALVLEDQLSALANLRLGLAVTLVHVIR